ncbi:sigma 54-interacting transcriptional regulator [Flavonifractor sp. HCP28S3_F3]|uniref:sigma 54-interacting transcriptional regulator n=1 Tax=Flavonifractor sp. HCP28S3_F3 TaxID=3438939 RepID=UPI003F8AEABF
MRKRAIAVFTESDVDRNYLCQTLSQIFSSYLDILPVTLATVHTLPEEPAAVLVNITSLAYAGKYFPNSKIIFVKRFIDQSGLQKLFEIPDGTSVLVVNKPRKIAEDLVENLYLLGIHHLKYVPYWPGCDLDTTPYDIVVYSGFRSYCPDNKKLYIDLGYRNIQPSTLTEIVKIYDLPSEFLDQIQISMMKQHVNEFYHLQTSYAQAAWGRYALDRALDISDTVLFHLDENQNILELSGRSEGLIRGGKSDVVGHPLSSCFAGMSCAAELEACLARREPVEQQVLFIRKRAYVLSIRYETFRQHQHCFLTLTPARSRPALGEAGSHPAKYSFQDIRGDSPAIQKAIRLGRYYAGANETVLIYGESGTGKELFAQSIHNASHRKSGPFIAVNCAAIPDTLIESELFGYEEGAFTGARRGGKQGLFQSAHRGTIFLDEIGDVSLQVQSRLLRVLEEREIMPVGSTQVIPVDVRVICATNKDLKQMVREGAFREDLYYRLKILSLTLPPLRERRGDIPDILEAVLGPAQLPERVTEWALRYSWPGNVRELRAFASNLSIFLQQNTPEERSAPLLDELMETFFGEEAQGPVPVCPASADQLLLLRSIDELTAAGKTAGRGSLLRLPQVAERGLTEARLKKELHRLSEDGLIVVGKTRQGIRLTDAGLAALTGA